MSEFRLPRFPRTAKLVNSDGTPSLEFQRWWQSTVERIERQEATQDQLIEDLKVVQDAQQVAIEAIQAAQAAAQEAREAAAEARQEAEAAQTAATNANTSIATINTTLDDYGTRINNLEQQP